MLNDLKSRAWDELQQVELWKQKLQQTQQEIANYKEPQEEAKKDDTTKTK
jgi:hypothetical protein